MVTYRGAPTPISEGTEIFDLGWQTDGREAYVVSEPSGASTFFPVNDHPTDKASYTFRVTAPEDQVVAANGLLESRDEVGHGMVAWTYDAPDQMASYLVQIAIGDYELVDGGEGAGVPIRHAFHRAQAEECEGRGGQHAADARGAHRDLRPVPVRGLRGAGRWTSPSASPSRPRR